MTSLLFSGLCCGAGGHPDGSPATACLQDGADSLGPTHPAAREEGREGEIHRWELWVSDGESGGVVSEVEFLV